MTHDHLELDLLTCLPLDANDVGDMSIDGVIGEETRARRRGARQTDLRVDVEGQSCSARRPDCGCKGDGISDQVITGERSFKVRLSRDLLRLCCWSFST